MQIKVRPVFVVGSMWPLLPMPNGQLEVITDQEAINPKVESLDAQIRGRLKADVELLEPAVLRRSSDVIKLREHALEADALLVYLMGLMPLAKLLDLEIPIIAFSGEYTPTMSLYAFPIEEREYRANLTVALDFKEIDDWIRLLAVKKRLTNTRVALIGIPLSIDGHWEHLPDPEMVLRKLGVEIFPVSGAEFSAEIGAVEEDKAEAVAQEWMSKGQGAAEPSAAEVKEVAKAYLAMHRILNKRRAQAAAIGCLELMYLFNTTPHCFALAALRDEGIPASCEADVSALLTMLMLGYLANKPAYMGNLVRADPENNLVMVSHGCSPAKMAGLDQPPMPYTLVHSHSAPPFTRVLEGGAGVTSYVDYADRRQEVTIARIGRDLDKMCAVSGEIVGCRDTVCDRTTLDIQVKNARAFFHNATGNHQVVVYGNHVEELRRLCQMLGIELIGE